MELRQLQTKTRQSRRAQSPIETEGPEARGASPLPSEPASLALSARRTGGINMGGRSPAWPRRWIVSMGVMPGSPEGRPTSLIGEKSGEAYSLAFRDKQPASGWRESQVTISPISHQWVRGSAGAIIAQHFRGCMHEATELVRQEG